MSESVKVTAKKPEARSEKSAPKAQEAECSQPVNSRYDRILFLQKTIGNQAVQRLFKSGLIQAKLQTSKPGDIYEREADRLAEQVMRMAEPQVQRQAEEEEKEPIQAKPLAEQITPLVQRRQQEEEEPIQPLSGPTTPLVRRQQEEEEEKEEEELQMKASPGQTPEVAPDLESRIAAMKGGGQPLPPSTRAFFEPRFGRDFSSVRVHNDGRAFETARTLNARAFTVGRDVAFGARQYAPKTAAGKHLLAHELTHVAQQASNTIIRRVPDLTPNLESLRQHLRDGQENMAIEVMGRLNPQEVERVLASREFKELAMDAFNNDEMYRGIRAMRGDLYRSLEWMFDEGTDWSKVRDVITRAPSGKDRVRTDNWMKEQFVSVCNDEEMAEAVDLLGGTLLQKLIWMKAEGSNWELVKTKVQATTDAAQRTALYGNNEMRDFFVDVCNNEQMAEAVGLLGGTLLQQLRWMKAEGSSWSLVKARIEATTDAAQKTALYGNNEMRDFFVDVCNNEQMAEAVGLLGGTLLQQLRWMKAEGSSWSLVKARIEATADAAQKTALYGNTEMRDLFVDVCNNEEMAEAVDLLGGTLLQKLIWMKAEGSDWSLVKARIEATADAAQRAALYGNTEMREFFMDICNNVEMKEAVVLLGFNLSQQLDWMIDEGTGGKLVCEVIVAAPQAQRNLVRGDAALMRRLRSELSAAGYARNRKRLGDEPPSGAALLPDVRTALSDAWNDSDVMDVNNRHEEGGWVIWSWVDDSIDIVRVPSGGRAGLATIAGTRPDDTDTEQVVAWFHTHPNPAGHDPVTGITYHLSITHGAAAGIIDGDMGFANGEGVPGLVREYIPPGTAAGGPTQDLNFGPVRAGVNPAPGACAVEQLSRDEKGRLHDQI